MWRRDAALGEGCHEPPGCVGDAGLGLGSPGEVARVLAPDGRFCVAVMHPALTRR